MSNPTDKASKPGKKNRHAVLESIKETYSDGTERIMTHGITGEIQENLNQVTFLGRKNLDDLLNLKYAFLGRFDRLWDMKNLLQAEQSTLTCLLILAEKQIALETKIEELNKKVAENPEKILEAFEKKYNVKPYEPKPKKDGEPPTLT